MLCTSAIGRPCSATMTEAMSSHSSMTAWAARMR